ncbi:MAG: PA2779 family protein [Elusimicrobiota bacterium]|nr:MAG: PA2779 family protein [Elusimicrobiota bacterium]
MRQHSRTLIFTLILTTTAMLAQPVRGWASLAPSGIGAESGAVSTRAADMKTVSTALESKVLRAKLKSMGLSEAETDARLSKLSDAEIRQLATRIEAVAPGGVVVEVLVIVALVLVVIYFARRV